MSEQVAEAKIDSPHTAKGFQFGVRQLLMYVVFVAVSLGLLKSPYVILSVIAKTFVIGALITAILLAIYRTGRLRAFWVGFATVGSIYFYLTLISTSFQTQVYTTMPFATYQNSYAQIGVNEESSHILTNWILLKAYTYIAMPPQPVQMPPPTNPYNGPVTTYYQPQTETTSQNGAVAQLITPPAYAAPAYPTSPSYSPIAVPTIPWSVFFSNGQCIFTILFAYIGGMFAQWLYVKRENA